MSEALPDDYAGYALVGQIDGRGSKHVIWVNNHSGSRAAAYPPEGICNSDTWATAEPMYRASDLAAHDREVKAEALKEVAGHRTLVSDWWCHQEEENHAASVRQWLRDHADRIESQETP